MEALLKLWSLWWWGQLPADSMLWGMNLVYWARIGKLAQFIGGVTIIADIIGPERIRAFGQSLYSPALGQRMVMQLRQARQWMMLSVRYIPWIILEVLAPLSMLFGVNAVLGLKARLELEKIYQRQIFRSLSFRGKIWMLLIMPTLFILLSFLFYHGITKGKLDYYLPQDAKTSIFTSVFFAMSIAGIITVISTMFVTAVLLVTIPILGLVFNFVLIAPLVWLLDRPSLERSIKILALLLLLLGFHFDFLAS